jgi:hypothetical protein
VTQPRALGTRLDSEVEALAEADRRLARLLEEIGLEQLEEIERHTRAMAELRRRGDAALLEHQQITSDIKLRLTEIQEELASLRRGRPSE